MNETMRTLAKLMFARMFSSYHQNQWGTSTNDVNKYFELFTTLVPNYYFGCDEMVKEL